MEKKNWGWGSLDVSKTGRVGLVVSRLRALRTCTILHRVFDDAAGHSVRGLETRLPTRRATERSNDPHPNFLRSQLDRTTRGFGRSTADQRDYLGARHRHWQASTQPMSTNTCIPFPASAHSRLRIASRLAGAPGNSFRQDRFLPVTGMSFCNSEGLPTIDKIDRPPSGKRRSREHLWSETGKSDRG
jgi:hypothetical protein